MPARTTGSVGYNGKLQFRNGPLDLDRESRQTLTENLAAIYQNTLEIHPGKPFTGAIVSDKLGKNHVDTFVWYGNHVWEGDGTYFTFDRALSSFKYSVNTGFLDGHVALRGGDTMYAYVDRGTEFFCQ